MQKKSQRHLTFAERRIIEEMLEQKCPATKIADKLGVHSSTIYREIGRDLVDGKYNAEYRQQKYEESLSKKGAPAIIKNNPALQAFISEKILVDRMKPKQIARYLNSEENKEFTPVSYATLYAAIENGDIPNVSLESLQTDMVRLFSGGQLMMPRWIMREFDLKDGDAFHIEVNSSGSITLTKEIDEERLS